MDLEDFVHLNPKERLDDLQCGGLRLIQRPDGFRFGTDSVLLADFAQPRGKGRAVDLGSGTGAIAMLMAGHHPELQIDGVEIQTEVADMARRSVVLNHLEERVSIYNLDMRNAWRTLGAGRYALAVCNPPYGRRGAALENASDTKRISRHECDLPPEDIAHSAAMLLKTGGRFALIYPAHRALEMLNAMTRNQLSPKRLRTVHGVEGRAPKFLLMDAVKGGGDGLHWLPPLVLRNADGSFSEEWHRIYDPI